MANDKIGRPSKERKALLRGQVSTLLWNGRIETTLAKAKSTARVAEKIITLAIRTFEDTVKVLKEVKGADGKKVKTEVLNDGPKKLAARRKIMSYVYDLQEQRKPKESITAYKTRIEGINHPIIEKIFNVYAPKYAERAKQSGQGGGYTRVVKLGLRRGDAAEMAIVELV
ncbi:MAG: 50S ribosomal protein L17 [Clostridiales bacterium]|nr:50S ribosomal protein L17 [Clostridiales bacterium]